jgi:hypothetical protein
VNPFDALHLPPDPALTDADIRAAWRAIAAQMHPDRPDGGNPAAYANAQIAYAQLRTGWGRSEALADLAVLPHIPPAPAPGPPPWHAPFTAAAILPARIVKGRPWRIAVRAIIAAAAGYAVTRIAPGTPAEPADIIGCATWWLFSSRADLAPSPGR